MKRWLKIGIPCLMAVILGITALILYLNIPRLTYRYVKEDDAYYVSKAYGNAKKYVIPSEYKDKPVVGIGERAFYRHSRLEEVVLPESVKLVERLAFSECIRLRSISLDEVDTIVRNAFSYCESLDGLIVSAKNIGASAFFKCSSLSDITLVEGIETIGSMAFYGTGLLQISIPRSVTVLGNDCFTACFALRDINVYGTNLKNNEYLKTLSIVNYIG